MCIDMAEQGSVVIYLKRRHPGNLDWSHETISHVTTTVTEVVLNTDEVASVLGVKKLHISLSAGLKYERDTETSGSFMSFITVSDSI